jgi:hypothetical protein
MSAAKYTPGPWHLQGIDGQGAHYIHASNGAEYTPVAVCPVGLLDSGEQMANSRLIAAAPELLAALERVMACPAMNEKMASPETLKAYDDARDAIAKARGES